VLAAIAVALGAAVSVLFLGAAPASAHGQFVRSDPVAGADVTTPLAAIYLYFTEQPTSNAYFAVTAPSGTRVDRLWSHGPTAPIDGERHEWYHQANGSWVVKAYTTAYSAKIPIAYWPETGAYKVQFLSVATDGEPVRGDFTFTYTGATSEVPADFSPQRSEPDPNLLQIAAAGAPTAPPTGPPIEEVVAAEKAGPSLWIVFVPIAIVVVIAVAAIVFWRMRPEQARELVVSRFGGRYAAPVQRRPSVLPAGLIERLPARLQMPGGRAGAPDATENPPAPAPRSGDPDADSGEGS
jgi:methionine-rich copper-binding protein CopC